MNNNLSPIIDILYETEEARVEGCRRACKLLSPAVTPTIEDILTRKEQRLGPDRLDVLLEDIATLFEDRRIRWNITDWPFENFWGNPSETRHSKYLGYFFDPNEKHGCGPYLLKHFFEATKILKSLEVDSYKVLVETRHKDYGQIDILIEGKSTGGQRFAVIIENKVKGADNQDEQLQRYVECVLDKCQLDYQNIYVIYLPLMADKEPELEDQKYIEKNNVKYEKVTFETNILAWLSVVMGEENEDSCPQNMRWGMGMRENLSHYRNLIEYLIKNKKERTMNIEILRQLELTEADRKPFPSWSSVDNLINSANALKQCLEVVLRGKLLLAIKNHLKAKNVAAQDVMFYSTGDGEVKELESPIDSPYDPQFEKEQSLCLRVNSDVLVCIGVCPPEDGVMVFAGYLRMGRIEEQEKIREIIIREAKDRFNMEKDNLPWYAWEWIEEINYDNCNEGIIVQRLAEKLVCMRDSVNARIKDKV
jgi:hypothetical protein